VKRSTEKPFRVIPVAPDSEAVYALSDTLAGLSDSDEKKLLQAVWKEFDKISKTYRENRETRLKKTKLRFIDSEAQEEDEDGNRVDSSGGDDSDGEPNEFDLEDPFIDDDIVTETREPITKRERLLSTLEKKKAEIDRLEKRLRAL
jgi:hypothetical protein